MDTTTITLPSVDELAARIYLATSPSSDRLCFEALPEAAKQVHRGLVREIQAVELRREAAEEDRHATFWIESEKRTVPGSLAARDTAARITRHSGSARRLRQRADELDMIGGAA